MKAISAHVTGFYRSSFHAYTTEVSVDGHRWRLGLRYSKFHEFYDQLLLQETDFHFTFPPKGSLFFTPKPEERQEQLEEFLQQVLAYYAAKGYPSELEDLLCELLKVPRHLKSPEHEDDDVSTSTESVLDEPLHEPSTDTLALEKEPLQEETASKTEKAVEAVQKEELPITEEKEPLQEEKVPETEKSMETVQDEAEEEDLPIDEEKEVAAIAVETEQSEEPRPVQVELPVVHEDAETQEEMPAPAEETQEEDPTPIEDEETEEIDVEAAIPHVTVEEAVTETFVAEQAVKEEAAVEIRPEEPVEVSPEVQQPVEVPIVKNEDLMVPNPLHRTPVVQPRNTNEAEIAVLHEKERKDLTTSGRVSSWIAAYLPESLLGFIRRRCLKKTNLVVLCVALLLPMVLARR